MYQKGEEIPDMPNKNIFHSKELFLIFERTSGFTPFLFAVYEGQRCLMHLLAYIQRDRSLFSHSFVKRCMIYGSGEYAPELTREEKENVFDTVLSKLTKQMSKKAFILEFRNLENSLFGYKSFHDHYYFPVNWLRVNNDLSSSQPLEKWMSPSRARQIKKGLKNGATVEEARNMEDVKAFSHMLKKVYTSHVRKYFPDPTFFYHLYETWHDSKKTKIFIVRYKDKIIGGSVCLYCEDKAYLWFSGGIRKTYILQYPGVLCVWKALSDAQESGYHSFEFMDAGLPFRKYGYRDFILRFGGKQSSTRRWFRVRWKWLNKLLIASYS
jgi:hypothetical protein